MQSWRPIPSVVVVAVAATAAVMVLIAMVVFVVFSVQKEHAQSALLEHAYTNKWLNENKKKSYL